MKSVMMEKIGLSCPLSPSLYLYGFHQGWMGCNLRAEPKPLSEENLRTPVTTSTYIHIGAPGHQYE
jgi:hypothetical protein